jgi:hypothetical protein
LDFAFGEVPCSHHLPPERAQTPASYLAALCVSARVCVRVSARARAYAISCIRRASWLTGEEHVEPTHATQRGGAVRVLRYGITTAVASMGLAIRGATLAYQVARRFCLTSLAAMLSRYR